jgi:hypothetical protein
MKKLPLFVALMLGTGAFAQTMPSTPPPSNAPPSSQPPPPPTSPPPTAQPMEPHAGVANSTPGSPGVPGEWVNTNQYGWVWVPYDQQYTHVVEDSGVAYEFVYYPSFGWRWVVAPWVLGIGPGPYFMHGPRRFAWYARPWFHAHPLVHREFHDSHDSHGSHDSHESHGGHRR